MVSLLDTRGRPCPCCAVPVSQQAKAFAATLLSLPLHGAANVRAASSSMRIVSSTRAGGGGGGTVGDTGGPSPLTNAKRRKKPSFQHSSIVPTCVKHLACCRARAEALPDRASVLYVPLSRRTGMPRCSFLQHLGQPCQCLFFWRPHLFPVTLFFVLTCSKSRGASRCQYGLARDFNLDFFAKDARRVDELPELRGRFRLCMAWPFLGTKVGDRFGAGARSVSLLARRAAAQPWRSGRFEPTVPHCWSFWPVRSLTHRG